MAEKVRVVKEKISSEFLQGGFCIKTKPCLLDCGSFKYSESLPLKPGDEARGANTYTAAAAYSTEPTVREGMGGQRDPNSATGEHQSLLDQ